MSDERFARNEWPTLGVEIELQLVDARSMALRSSIADVLAGLAPGLGDSVKPEFMQCYVEINSEVSSTVDDVEADLARKVRAVEQAAARSDVRLFWAATHPFSRWRDQVITPNERYYRLAEMLQETVCRPVTFGLHVHVGVESGDKAIALGNRLAGHLPALLALSANSPFWQGRRTGLHSYRTEALEGFPTGGLPPHLGGWADYVALVEAMVGSGFIESSRELWWDVRPNHAHGTVELRICDMPSDLAGVLALTALAQCLVRDLSRRIDRGGEAPQYHPLMVRQNRWRAGRYGLDAGLVDPSTRKPEPARDVVRGMAARLMGHAADLGCVRHLERALAMADEPTGAERQLALFEQSHDLAEVVRRSVDASALGPIPAGPPGLGFPTPWGPGRLANGLLHPGFSANGSNGTVAGTRG